MTEAPLPSFLRGDPDTLQRTAALIRRIVNERGYGIPVPDRGDIVQETLIELWRTAARPGFRLRRGFDALVRTIAYRRCVDHLRRQRRVEPYTATHAVVDSPDTTLIRREQVALGRRVLERLKDSCRELMRLRMVDGLHYSEMATRLGRSEGALRNAMYKCLGQARRVFEELTRQGSSR